MTHATVACNCGIFAPQQQLYTCIIKNIACRFYPWVCQPLFYKQ